MVPPHRRKEEGPFHRGQDGKCGHVRDRLSKSRLPVSPWTKSSAGPGSCESRPPASLPQPSRDALAGGVGRPQPGHPWRARHGPAWGGGGQQDNVLAEVQTRALDPGIPLPGISPADPQALA